MKKDGRKEQFDRDKLKHGILKSCEKTIVGIDDIDTIVDDVEKELRGMDTVEVESKKIGQLVAQKLKKIDKIAYIRFASVFRRFVDVEDFEKEKICGETFGATSTGISLRFERYSTTPASLSASNSPLTISPFLVLPSKM